MPACYADRRQEQRTRHEPADVRPERQTRPRHRSSGGSASLWPALASASAELVLNGRDPTASPRPAPALAAEGTRAGHGLRRDGEAEWQAVARIEAELGPIDILVNNAGMQIRAPLDDFPVESWRALMRLNLDSVFPVSQAVAPR